MKAAAALTTPAVTRRKARAAPDAMVPPAVAVAVEPDPELRAAVAVASGTAAIIFPAAAGAAVVAADDERLAKFDELLVAVRSQLPAQAEIANVYQRLNGEIAACRAAMAAETRGGGEGVALLARLTAARDNLLARVGADAAFLRVMVAALAELRVASAVTSALAAAKEGDEEFAVLRQKAAADLRRPAAAAMAAKLRAAAERVEEGRAGK